MISRTAGKIAFIDHEYRGVSPENGEFWYSSITKEFNAGKVKGCFLSEPFERVDYESILSLNRTNCTIHARNKGSTILIDPAKLWDDGYSTHNPLPWMLPLELRKQLQAPKVVAIVVCLGGEDWKILS